MTDNSMWQVTDAIITALKTIREKCNPTIEGCMNCPLCKGFRVYDGGECICILQDNIPADWELEKIKRSDGI